MARTLSTMLELGTPAPDFRLPDFDGRVHSLDGFAGAPALLVAFICNHCPFVRHLRAEFAALAREYAPRGLAVVAIMPNDPEAYPQDGPDAMRREAAEFGYVFPYLVDQSQAVAKAYRAACTPDFFLFDASRRLAYRGQFDDSHSDHLCRRSAVNVGRRPVRREGHGGQRGSDPDGARHRQARQDRPAGHVVIRLAPGQELVKTAEGRNQSAAIEIGWLEAGESKTVTWQVKGAGTATVSAASTRGGIDRRDVAIK